jgi:diguanylate cyclase (GGDEF)-like protein
MSELSSTSREPGRGLFSVAQIQHVMRTEFHRAQRYRYPLACMLIAIDQLGPLRDLHGYEVKERIVAGVVRLLEEATRTSDFLGRTADDRLMAVIPHTSPEGARTLARRLLAGVRQIPLEGAERAPITLSIGSCTNQHEAIMYSDTLLGVAEEALATAVAQGGDRYVEGTPPGMPV